MLFDSLSSSQVMTILFIFFARITDVSLGTMRIMLISRGYRQYAPILGFFEVLIWLITISKVLASLSGPMSYIAYAGGFATGNYIGMLIEGRISLGYQALRIITTHEVSALPISLREEGFTLTVIRGRGLKGDVTIIFMVVRRRDIPNILDIVTTLEPAAFITSEDVKPYNTGFISLRNMPGIMSKNIVKKK